REQFGIEMDRVGVLGKLRRQRLLGGLQRLVGVRRGHGEEDRRGAGQQGAAALQRLDGVGEARRFGALGDLADFGQVLAHAFLDRRLVVRVLDVVEQRCLERQRAGGEERVFDLCGRGGYGGGIRHRWLGGRAGAGAQGERDRGRQPRGTQHGGGPRGGRDQAWPPGR